MSTPEAIAIAAVVAVSLQLLAAIVGALLVALTADLDDEEDER